MASAATIKLKLARARRQRTYRRRKWNFYRYLSKRPISERKRLRAKWWKLYSEADARVAKLEAQLRDIAPTTVSNAGLRLIMESEGFRSKRYKPIPSDPWTIGYGETSPSVIAAYRNGITEPEARRLLRRRVDEFTRGVRRQLRRAPSQGQLDAMVSLAYNIGLGAFADSTLLRKFNAGDRAGAANEFLRWVRAGGRVLPGLVTRRRAERKLFLS